MSQVTLYRLSVVCPECGAPPRLRRPPDVANLFRPDAPRDALFQTYQCAVKKCGAIYEIKVGDFYRIG